MPAIRGPEANATRKFIALLDTLTFDPAVFVSLMTGSNVLIQRRALSLLVSLIDAWSIRYDKGMWRDDEELEFLVSVKRIQDALAGFQI